LKEREYTNLAFYLSMEVGLRWCPGLGFKRTNQGVVVS